MPKPDLILKFLRYFKSYFKTISMPYDLLPPSRWITLAHVLFPFFTLTLTLLRKDALCAQVVLHNPLDP